MSKSLFGGPILASKKTPTKLGDLFRADTPEHAMQLDEALAVRSTWPDLPSDESPNGGLRAPDEQNAFVLLVARLTTESPAALAAAMSDPSNVAGRALRKLQPQMQFNENERRQKAGRPPSRLYFAVRLLDAVAPTGSKRGSFLAAGAKKLGVRLQPSELQGAARRARRAFRVD